MADTQGFGDFLGSPKPWPFDYAASLGVQLAEALQPQLTGQVMPKMTPMPRPSPRPVRNHLIARDEGMGM